MTKDEALKMAIDAMSSAYSNHGLMLQSNPAQDAWLYHGCDAKLFKALQACKGALETPECNTHPKAPHGFNRNASHSAGRYVCDCEGWQLEWQGLSDDEIYRIYGEVQDNCVKDFPSELYAAWFKNTKEKNAWNSY